MICQWRGVPETTTNITSKNRFENKKGGRVSTRENIGNNYKNKKATSKRDDGITIPEIIIIVTERNTDSTLSFILRMFFRMPPRFQRIFYT